MKNRNESGRSMLEMLGVLAVIGFLSATAMYGYIQAMDSHLASQTVDHVMKRAMGVSTQKMLGQDGDLRDFTETCAYAITLDEATKTPATPTFTLQAASVPLRVCQKIKSYDWTLPVIIPGTCGETNNMTFTFNNDLSNNTSEDSQNSVCTGVQCGTNCCPVDATCDPNESNKCCIDLYAQGNILCGYEPGELYCMRTDSNGDCEEWSYAAGPNSGSNIVGVPNANGTETDDGNEIYCMTTNEDGQCTQWASCEEGKSSGDWIIGAPYGLGECMYSDDTYLYCCSSKQDKDDPCSSYCSCPNGVELTCWNEDAQGNCLEQACVTE